MSKSNVAASARPRQGIDLSPTVQAMALRSFWTICRVISRRAAGAFGARLLGWVGPRTRRNRKIVANLRAAFPDKPPEEIALLSKQIWRNFGRILSEFQEFGRIARGGVERAPFDYNVAPETAELLRSGRAVVFIGAHISNWEIGALAVRMMGVPLSVVYSTLRNGAIDDVIRRAREEMGCRLIARTDGIRPLVECLRSGVSVGLVVDRRMKGGTPVTFFGRPTFFSQAPARLAIKYGAPVVPSFVTRTPGDRLGINLAPPIWPESFGGDDRTRAAAVTQAIADLIEDEVRARPGEWLCSQRIWPDVAYDDAPPRATFALDA